MEGIYEEVFSVKRSAKYQVLHKIGEGAFGEVRKAADVQTGRLVALKYVRLGTSGRGEGGIPRAAFREMEALKQLKSRHIVALLDIYPFQTNIVLVFEYMKSDLSQIIIRSPSRLPSSSVRYISLSILQGVAHCHASGIIHRDIKPSNILISHQGDVKIADFGLARILDERSEAASMSHQVATRWYRSPELLFGARRYSTAVDIWAVGAVIAELITLSPLFPGSNDIDQMFKVFQVLGTPTHEAWPEANELPDYNKVSFPPMQPLDPVLVLPTSSPQAREFIFRMLCLNPQSRFSAKQAMRHLYLQDVASVCPPDIVSLISDSKAMPYKSVALKGEADVKAFVLSLV